MTSAIQQLLPFSLLLFLIQGVAAIPWLCVVTGRPIRQNLPFYGKVVGGITVGGFFFAFLIHSNSDPAIVSVWGRLLAALLSLQLGFDAFVLTFFLLLTFWPKGGAVCLAAFQESIRQPMFWLITIVGSLMMVIFIVIPYFTFGEDLKMLKELTYALTMILPALFGVITASLSVSEEIEGRTAVTLLSKPVTRRQFLLGKFLGITLGAVMMTMFMGWVLVWVVLAKTHYDHRPGLTTLPPDSEWLTVLVRQSYGDTAAGDLLRGLGRWTRDLFDALPGLVIGFGQVMTLVAVSVALATRLPMMVNMAMCLLVYLLGHLTPIMTEVSRNPLVSFIAKLFELLLPGLELFDVGTAIVREVPLDPAHYAVYTASVVLYALIYTAIAMMVGLILFEDRDVA